MRNLKKILALVLALIMSLSLMATAGATEFPDDDKISDTYRTAAEVLTQLNVFAGDQNGNFNPTDNIRRSEVAAILYRIGTGDVGTEGHKTYAPYNQFKDVQTEDWYAGYVTYCANAGWIKGRNTGNFDANDNVTGYEVLAMILRAVGYDKNNEFVGSNWQMNTASIAREKGVLVNVLTDPSVQLSQPATRQVVAELLFRASLLPQVTWNAATLSYREDGETLGKVNFGLEDVSGVVTANQWANINDDSARVLADDTTELTLADGSTYVLAEATDLDAVGQTYTAYVADSTDGSNTKRSLILENTGNTVAFNEGKSVNTGRNDEGFGNIAAVAAQEKITLTDDTLYYLNYDLKYEDLAYTDIIIRYAVATIAVDGYTQKTIVDTDGNGTIDGSERVASGAIFGNDGKTQIEATDPNKTWQRYKNEVQSGNVLGHSVETRTIRVNWDVNGSGNIDANDTLDCYVFTIQPEYRDNGAWVNTVINEMDLTIMQDIFYNADRLGTNNNDNANYATQNYVYGEVYVGTTSMTDESDTLSWKQFTEKYFITDETVGYNSCGNGESIRVIDNDGDGKAEYVFKVTYNQDKAITTYRDALEFHKLVPASNTVWEDEIEVGDVVNYRTIDGKITVWKADKVTDTIKAKSFRDITVTTSENGDFGQSAITNNTNMSDDIMNMLDKTEYNMYLDEFGYIRTYELAQGSEYALVTEVYPTNQQNQVYVTTNNWIAEIKAGEADPHEYTIANPGTAEIPNPFISNYAWSARSTQYVTNAYLNYLQPAIAHLDMFPDNVLNKQFMGATLGNVANVPGWTNRSLFPVANAGNTTYYPHTSIRANPALDYGVFDYGTGLTETDHHGSYTNVAIYALGENETVSLRTASQLAYDKNGQQLYRVGSTAVDGSSPYGAANKNLVPGAFGTEQQLKDMWVHDNTNAATGIVNDGKGHSTPAGKVPTAADIADAANAWWNDNYSGSSTKNVAKDGTMIYPIYAVDYIQLAKQDVDYSKRHYNIDVDYSENFNTNSNSYVNAVLDTQFYVVEPNKVTFYETYNDLPDIDADDIWAMYAVATNTTANASGLDFWTADVIVIETRGTVNYWDSMSLMFYNPWESASSIRYVDSLNNEWADWYGAPDAEIPVVPTTTSGTNYGTAAWGNHSWRNTEYGFYGLTGTEYNADADELTAANAERITKGQYNDNGIYAGTLRRATKALVDSGYVDVDWAGRTGQLYDDALVQRISIKDVPIYFVDSSSATLRRLAPESAQNQVEVGDRLIYVYSWGYDGRAEIAYIVTLDSHVRNWNAPTWLTTIYGDIIDEQTNGTATTTSTIAFDLNLTAGQTATFTYTNNNSQTVTTAALTADDSPAELTVGNVNSATVRVKLTGTGASLSYVTTVAGSDWRVISVTPVVGETNTYDIELINNTNLFGRSARAASDAEVIGGIWTKQYVEDLKTKAVAVSTIDTAEKLAAAKVIQNQLKELTANDTVAVTGNTVTALDTTLSTLNGKVTSGESTVNAAAFAAEKAAAKTAIDALIAKKPGAADDETVAAKKAALVTLIDACAADSEETATTLSTYWKNGALVETQAAVKALIDALANYTPSNLDVEKENALKAVEALVAPYAEKLEKVDVPAVGTAKAALENAIKACTSEDTTATTGLLNYWTGTKLVETNASVKALTDALASVDTALKALTDAKTAATEAVNAAPTTEQAAKLSPETLSELATKKDTALKAITAAKTTAAVETAKTTYTDAVTAAVEAADAAAEALATAKTTAKTALGTAATQAIAALTFEDTKTADTSAINTAKSTGETNIDNATSEDGVTEAKDAATTAINLIKAKNIARTSVAEKVTTAKAGLDETTDAAKITKIEAAETKAISAITAATTETAVTAAITTLESDLTAAAE